MKVQEIVNHASEKFDQFAKSKIGDGSKMSPSKQIFI